jgi:hypothetical protein
MEILLKERNPWKEPDRTTVLTGRNQRKIRLSKISKSQSGEEILCGDQEGD